VIGGAHGGPSAVAFARQTNEDARIVLIEKEPHVTWVEANLRHHLEGKANLCESDWQKNDASFEREYDVSVMTNTLALSIDMDARAVNAQTGSLVKRIGFDRLVYAGGAISEPLPFDVPIDACVANFRNLYDLNAIKSALASGAKRAVVLGGGFYGIEAAQALCAQGTKVTLVEKRAQLMSRFSLLLGQAIKRDLEKLGVELIFQDEAVGLTMLEKSQMAISLRSGRVLETDLMISAIGSRPRSNLLAEAGAALLSDGSILVDAEMCTTLPGVYACGSAVSLPHVLLGERVWLPQPSMIERSAQVAGVNAAAFGRQKKDCVMPRPGAVILQVGPHWYGKTGLSHVEARLLFDDADLVTSTVHGLSAESWADGDELCVRLLLHKAQNRILGGEVFGQAGVARRLDILSILVSQGLSPEHLVNLDMAYSAVLGPAFDPLKEAGARAIRVISEDSRFLSTEELALWMAEQRRFTLIDVGMKPAISENSAEQLIEKLWVPLEDLRNRVSEFDAGKPIVLSSLSGKRALVAERILNQRGLKNVYQLEGGRKSWELVTAS